MNKKFPIFFITQKLLFSFCCFLITITSFSQTYQLHGYVKDANTKESLIGVNIIVKEEKSVSQSNNYGFFSLKLSSNKNYQIIFSSVGYETDTLFIEPTKTNTILEIVLQPIDYQLDEVIVKADHENTKLNQISSLVLTPAEIKTIPLIFGEKDPIKAFQLLPGVQQASEGK